MNDAFKEVVSLDTLKVAIAAATPYLVHLTNLEALFKVCAAGGAVCYIWLKIWLLYRNNSDEEP